MQRGQSKDKTMANQLWSVDLMKNQNLKALTNINTTNMLFAYERLSYLPMKENQYRETVTSLFLQHKLQLKRLKKKWYGTRKKTAMNKRLISKLDKELKKRGIL